MPDKGPRPFPLEVTSEPVAVHDEAAGAVGSRPGSREGEGVSGRSGVTPELLGGWLWPYWLQRQLDPRSPDYLPGDPAAASRPNSGSSAPGWRTPIGSPGNFTHHNWTLIGNLGTWRRGQVDPRGLLTPVEGGWSLDWWVRSEDRWHLPSCETAVRQRCIDDMPVVETAMRVPGGDVLHRAYGALAATAEMLVVEVENASAVPVAVAFSIRPYGPTGRAEVRRIELDASAERLSVDGREALVFPKAPAQMAWSDGSKDCVEDVLAERTRPPEGAALIEDPGGWAQAAFVFPLAHSAIIRVALPRDRAGDDRGRSRASAGPSPGREVAGIAEAARVAAGWRAHGDRGIRIDLPDERLQAVLDAARRQILLAHGGEDLVTVPAAPLDYSEAQALLHALDTYGYGDEVDQVLTTWPEHQHDKGWFGARSRGDANGAALHTLARHWQLARAVDPADETALLVARAARAIDKRRSSARRRDRSQTSSGGWLPAGDGPAGCGPAGTWVRDAVWSCQGLHDAVGLLEVLGQDDAAADAADMRARFEHDLRVALASLPGDVWPSTIERGVDGGVVANLDALNLPLTLEADLPGRDATLDAIRDGCSVGPSVHRSIGPAGLSPRLTAMLARAVLHAGGDADPHVRWLVSNASPTGAWAGALHPTRGGGTVGPGHDLVATAWFLLLVRDCLVREAGPSRLALCTNWPESWLGQGVEVHAAPTTFGQMSFAVRWHGERPALLWELEPHEGEAEPVELVVPGLDGSWSCSERTGEALLSAPTGAASEAVSGVDGHHVDSYGQIR